MTGRLRRRSPRDSIAELFAAKIQTFTDPPPYYRSATHRFLSFLQAQFPDVRRLSQLRREPHMTGWVRSLAHDAPLSISSRRIYLVALRRLLRDFVNDGHALPSGLILPEDFPAQPSAKKDRALHPRLRKSKPPRSQPHPLFLDIFDAAIQTLAVTSRPDTVQSYRAAVRRFLCYLYSEFPQLSTLSQLSRDPHLLGWFRHLAEQHPPLSPGTRQLYLLKIRRLLQHLDSLGYGLQPALIVPADIPAVPRPRPVRPAPPPPHVFQEIFEAPLQCLTAIVRPGTVATYRLAVRSFLCFLRSQFSQLLEISELRRDPHMFAWFRHLCQQHPPLSSNTRQKYLFALRRLLTELASCGHDVQIDLIVREDFPPLPQYLPRALSPEDDQRLQQELRRCDDLLSNALLLTRATGIRIGECINLAADCLKSLGQDQWALHVPLGKLYTERFVPVDADVIRLIERLKTLRQLHPCPSAVSAVFLLPRPDSGKTLYHALRKQLRLAAQRAACSHPVTCHQLRHTYATEMLRLGVSLPALMQLLGHKQIRMTMRYLKITQLDLQREFHLARQNAAQLHLVPNLPLPHLPSMTADIAGIQRSLTATRHLLEMYRRTLANESHRRIIRRLDRRLLNVADQLDRLRTPPK
jgi:site-specific recombinase XerD